MVAVERDCMPQSTWLSTVVILALLASGCATTGRPGGEAVYRESTVDVANRAPDSMSIPLAAEAAVIDPLHLRTQADYHFTLGESYSLEGNSARATEEYKLTLVYDPKSPLVRLRLAAEYVKQGLISEAIEQGKVALEIDPKHEDARLLLGGLYSALRMYDDAMSQYQAVLKNNPDNLEAPMFIGALLAEQKKYPEAAQYFEKLAKSGTNPNTHLAWFYLGRVRLEEGREKNVSKAEAAFQQSLAARSSFTDAALALGQLYETTGRRPQALQLYSSFQERHGPNALIAEELSKLFIETKDYNRAFDQLAIMETSDPDDLSPKVKMAFILIEQQKYQDAILRLEDILARAPASDKVRFYLGAVYEEVKDYRSAINHFKKIQVGSSYYQEAIIHASYLYKLLGDYDRAIATIQDGIKTQDDHPPFYALYASLLDDQKQYAKAVDMLNGAVAKFPDHAQLNFFLGSMRDRVGDKPGTVEAMKRVLSIDKDHLQALNFLAYTYADSGTNLDEAEKMVRRAIELQPNDGYILDTLGWILYKKGRVAEAIRVLEAAYKIQPDESVIAEHLADAYYQQQMPEKAKRLYQKAVEAETNVATIEKIRAKINAIDRQTQSLGFGDDGRRPASAKSP